LKKTFEKGGWNHSGSFFNTGKISAKTYPDF